VQRARREIEQAADALFYTRTLSAAEIQELVRANGS